MRSPSRPERFLPPPTKLRNVCLTASRRLLWRPSTCKSRAAILPEISTAMRMAMPSLETLMASRPRCGRARARMQSSNVRVRKQGSTQRQRYEVGDRGIAHGDAIPLPLTQIEEDGHKEQQEQGVGTSQPHRTGSPDG